MEARLVLLKGWAEIRLAPRQFALLRRYVRVVWRAISPAERACEACFPAGTLVAAPDGQHAIQTLRAGDTVLSENPSSGTVEAEPVQAVITDPVSPLVAVQLSDGSAITATATHPFWVDLGDGPRDGTNVGGWVEAGQLEPGDHLRAASGRVVVVTGVKQHAGEAPVYTLTVARDHTFFVGPARVLVHNCEGLPLGFASTAKLEEFSQRIREHLSGLVHYYEAYIGGSAATGKHYHTGVAFGSHSDIDLAIVSKELFEYASQEGAG